jgi:hypothetical protein
MTAFNTSLDPTPPGLRRSPVAVQFAAPPNRKAWGEIVAQLLCLCLNTEKSPWQQKQVHEDENVRREWNALRENGLVVLRDVVALAAYQLECKMKGDDEERWELWEQLGADGVRVRVSLQRLSQCTEVWARGSGILV